MEMTNPIAVEARNKLNLLNDLLAGMGSAVVGFSAGVDSTFLLYAAVNALGQDKVLAVTGKSKIIPQHQVDAAEEYAEQLGARHEITDTRELEKPGFRDNPPDRCYLCKSELYTRLSALAKERGYATVVDGSNADDLKDYRPGMRAISELGIRSPMLEVGLTKQEIRYLSGKAGLPTWDKPAFPCLGSRIPYGIKITDEALARIDKAEQYLKSLAIQGPIRVRHHGDLARIEVNSQGISFLLASGVHAKVAARLKELGYKYVTLDLQGFRSGSLNEAIDQAGQPG